MGSERCIRDSRSARVLRIEEHPDHGDVTQWLVEPEESNEGSLIARVDLRASDEAGEPEVTLVMIGSREGGRGDSAGLVP